MELSNVEEVVQYFLDYGLTGALLISALFLGIKYLPQFIEIKLNHMKEKDYMLDSFKAVVENNSQVISNNSKVIEQNSITIKNYTDNSNKLESKIEELTDEIRESKKLQSEELTGLKILLERK